MSKSEAPSWEAQHREFISRKFTTMPIAGAIAWAAVGTCGFFFTSEFAKAMSVFVGTGVIFYLALFIQRFTGEDLLGKHREKNIFDRFFLLTVFQAVAVYSIAIPFFMIEPSSLPLSVGILTGLMWIPFSGFIGHWVGLFHAISRTAAIVALWYLFPDLCYVTIPIAIVLVYVVTIWVLIQRYRDVTQLKTV